MAQEVKVFVRTKDHATKPLNTIRGKFRAFSKDVRKTLSFGPLGGLFAGFGLLQIGKQFIKAGSSIDSFRVQLQMVTNDAKKAEDALNAIREFARTSPLETEDVVQAYVRMRAVGINPTMEQMKTMGGVAVLFNKQLSELLDSFIGLNKRTLRQIGIEIDRTGSKAIIMSGNIRKEVSKDSASIRQAILETWAERFPDAINKASQTFSARLAVFKSEIFEKLLVPISNQFLPQTKAGFDALGKKVIWVSKTIMFIATGFKIAWNAAKIMVRFVLVGLGQLIVSIMGVMRTIQAMGQTMIIVGSRIGRALAAIKDRDLKGIKEAFKGMGTEIAGEFKVAGDQFAEVGALWDIFKAQSKGDLNSIVAAIENYNKTVRNIENPPSGELAGTGKLGAGAVPKEDTDKLASKRIQALKLFQDLKVRAMRDGYEKEKQVIDNEYLRQLATIERYHNEEVISDARHKEMLEAAEAAHQKRILKLKRDTLTESLSLTQGLLGELSSVMMEHHQHELNLQLEKIQASNMSDDMKEQASKRARARATADAAMARRLAIGETLISTFLSAQKVFEGFAKIPVVGVPLGIAAAAATTAMGLKRVQMIKQQKFASGTRFAPGGPAIVGEFGPELVNVPRGSSIAPASETRKALGGDTHVHITNTFQGPVDQSVMPAFEDTMKRTAREVHAAIRSQHLNLRADRTGKVLSAAS